MDIDIDGLVNLGWIEMIEDTPRELIVDRLSEYLNQDFDTKVSILQPQLKSGTYAKSLSETYGYQVFPYHTDGTNYIIPPRYLILRYLGNYHSAANTLLLDSDKFEDDPDFRILSEEEVYYVTWGNPNFYTTIKNVTILPGRSIFRFNQLIMKKQNKKSMLSFEDFIKSYSPDSISWVPNKVVILDNWRILHSRERVPENEINTRQIERTYLFEND